MPKSTVLEAAPTGSYDGRSGTLYTFDIVMSDGTAGQYSSKNPEQDKFVVGLETEYEYIGGQYPKIKPIYQQNPGGQKPAGKSGYSRPPFEENIIGYATSYAKDLAVAGKIELKDLGKYAKKFQTVMLEMKNPKPPEQNASTEQPRGWD